MRKVRIFGVFVMLLCLLTVVGRAEAMPECKSSKPVLNFKTATSSTSVVRSKSSKDLTQMHGGAGYGSAVGGLGGGELGFKTESRFEIVQQGGQACVKLKAVNVVFFAKPQIHIASNFNRASCEYNAVMAHEKKHITALLKFQREMAPKTRAYAQKILGSMSSALSVSTSEIDKAQDLFQTKLSRGLQAYNGKVMSMLSARQQTIDSPQEYARVSAQCSKWDQKLAKEPQKKKGS